MQGGGGGASVGGGPSHPGRAVGAPRVIVRHRTVRYEGLAQGEVQVHRPGTALERGPVRAAGERAHEAQALRVGVLHADLEEPLGGRAVELDLVDRLARPGLAQLRRSVGGEDDQRDARLAGLVHGRRQLGGGRSGGAGDRHRAAARLGEAEREEAGAALVDVGVTAEPLLAREREHERRRPGSGGGAGIGHAAARELVGEGAQEPMGVGRGHDAGVRPTVVLLHGFSQTGASWRAVIDALGERYTPLAPDLRGHGSAGAARPVGVEACVADVAAAAPDRFALAGYSMGGRLALRLVLIGTTAGIADPLERDARREADEALAEELDGGLDIEAFARRWARQPILRGQPPEVAAAAHEDRLRNDPTGLAAALRGLGPGAYDPVWSRLGELRMPVIVIAGERDAKYAKLAERMVARLPRARALIVPATGHAVHLEAPAIVAAALAGQDA